MEKSILIGPVSLLVRYNEDIPLSHGPFWERVQNEGASADSYTIDVQVQPTALYTQRGPSYPAFEIYNAADTICFERFDASGWINLEERTGNFLLGPSHHSLEAIVRIFASMVLPLHGAFLLHSSAVASEAKAYVFSGISGAGKSTISDNLNNPSKGNYKLSDEIVLVTRTSNGWFVKPTPFIGTTWNGTHEYPLERVHFVRQSETNQWEPLTPFSAIGEMAKHLLLYSQVSTTAEAAIDLLTKFSGEVTMGNLKCTNSPHVAEAVFQSSARNP